jgi:hypothetical protein
MTDAELVLVSTGRIVACYHRQFADTQLIGCGRFDPDADVELRPRDETDAAGYTACGNCSSPERANRGALALIG